MGRVAPDIIPFPPMQAQLGCISAPQVRCGFSSSATQAQLEYTVSAPRVRTLAQLPCHRRISPVGIFVHRASDEAQYNRHVSANVSTHPTCTDNP